METQTEDVVDIKEPEQQPIGFVKLKQHEPVELPNKKLSKPPKSIDIKNGDYHRIFDTSENQFPVYSTEEMQMLKSSGFFEAVDVAEAPVATAPKKKPATGKLPAAPPPADDTK